MLWLFLPENPAAVCQVCRGFMWNGFRWHTLCKYLIWWHVLDICHREQRLLLFALKYPKSEVRARFPVATSQKNKNISEFCCFKHANISVWHAGSLVPELTWSCSSPQARTEPPPQSEVHLYDHIHTSGNRVPTETQQRGTALHFTTEHRLHCETFWGFFRGLSCLVLI